MTSTHSAANQTAPSHSYNFGRHIWEQLVLTPQGCGQRSRVNPPCASHPVLVHLCTPCKAGATQAVQVFFFIIVGGPNINEKNCQKGPGFIPYGTTVAQLIFDNTKR